MTVDNLGIALNKARFLQMCCLTILISGCVGNDYSDLNRYVQTVKSKPKGSIEKLPEIKEIESFVFKDDVSRDPFKPVEKIEQEQRNVAATGNGLRPDFQRRKEELEAFSLDALKMVGSVSMKSKLWGLVKAADNTVHRVQVGNYMGKNYGKIIRIGTDKIELTEIVPDKPGTWREQQTTLVLTE